MTLTLNSPNRHLGSVTYGGYSESSVVDERFVLRVPSTLDPARAAPLLCTGITTYSPMRHSGVARARRSAWWVSGLGHMAVKFAHALGAQEMLDFCGEHGITRP
jgi:uncharacterized zinc-type alcohol dehydrogenase-like protein